MLSRTMRVLVVGAAALLLAQPAAAQRRGTMEVGGFTRYVNFDNSLGMGSALAVGARATLYLGSRLALDVDVAHGAGNSVSYTPVHLRLVERTPVGGGNRLEALFGVGYVRNWYGAPYHESDGGVSVILGLGYQLNGRLWLHGGADLDAMFHTAGDSPFPFYHGNWGLRLGLGLPFNR
jgi:hypothetical protein